MIDNLNTTGFFNRGSQNKKALKYLASKGTKVEGTVATLYHGSTRKHFKPRYSFVEQSRVDSKESRLLNLLDLGEGLYLDPYHWSANDWANEKFTEGSSYRYTYNLDFKGLKVLVLDENDSDNLIQYIAMLVHYHGNAPYTSDSIVKNFDKKYYDKSFENYDVIIAPRLDSKYRLIVQYFIKGLISLECFKEVLCDSGLGVQVFVQTLQGFRALASAEEPEDVTYVPIVKQQKLLRRRQLDWQHIEMMEEDMKRKSGIHISDM